jgi:hypothetical protein
VDHQGQAAAAADRQGQAVAVAEAAVVEAAAEVHTAVVEVVHAEVGNYLKDPDYEKDTDHFGSHSDSRLCSSISNFNRCIKVFTD